MLNDVRDLTKMFAHIVDFPRSERPYRLNQRISKQVRRLCRMLRRHPEFITPSELRILCSEGVLDAESMFLVLEALFERLVKEYEEESAKPTPYPKTEETEERNVFPPVRPRILQLMSGLPVPY